MRYLLDANVIVGLLKGHPRLTERLRRCFPSEVGLPAIVAHELFFGAFKSQRTAYHLAQVDALQFETLAFDREDAREAGEVCASLARAGTTIGSYDV